MRSRMTPEQLAAAKAKTDNANGLNAMATRANGHGVSRADKQKADAALIAAVGKRKAKQFKETALQRAGAPRRGLGRLFG